VTISLLYCGVDTLEATFAGELEDRFVATLQEAKDRAQLTDEAQSYRIADHELFVSPKGLGKYRFVLSDADMQLRVSIAQKGIPPVSVRLFAASLATCGHEPLYERATRLAAALGADKPYTLSRIDLCLDVHGWEPGCGDIERIVCPASFRQKTEEGEGISYQIGKGDVVLRIYRKDAELAAKKKTAYAKVWERVAHYDPSRAVWRFEVQLRGDVLNELNARAVATAFAKLPRLFAFGMTWAELRIPTDGNKTRWPVDPVWATLRELWGASAPEPRVRYASRAEHEERVIARLYGALAALGAYCDQDDLLSVMEYALPLAELQLADRGIEFAELVAKARARQIAEQGVPF